MAIHWRAQVLRTVTAMANARQRQQSDHTERQIARMNRYYADLRRELQEQVQRGPDHGDYKRTNMAFQGVPTAIYCCIILLGD